MKLFLHTLVLLFFISVFFYFYHPVNYGDIWIHLNGGRWIWEHGGFPSEDPFVFTTMPENADRLSLMNRGYWLAQIAFFGTYKYFGFQGLNIFHAALFTLIFYVLWRILRYQGMDPFIALVVLIPCVLLAIHYDELRPKNFSYLNILILYYILEKGIHEVKESQHQSSLRTFILLLLLIIIWANLYRGFIIIYVVLASYLAGEALSHRYKNRMPKINLFVFWIVLAMLSSLLTPNFIKALTLGSGEVLQTYKQFPIIELSSPWEYSAITGSHNYFLTVLVLVIAMTGAILVAAWRQLEYSHVFLFICFALLGALAFRFTFLFVLIAVVVAGKYAHIPKNYVNKLMPVAVIFSIIFVLFLITESGRNFHESESLFVDSKAMPTDAVDYLIDNKLPQPIFNPFYWGGYISWKSYQQYKVFTDSRFFDPPLSEEIDAERTGAIIPLLNKYRINTVIYIPIASGQIKWIILGLLKDNNWVLVYFDRKAAIFVRSGIMPSLRSMSKQDVYDYLMLYAQLQIRDNPMSADGYSNLADIYRAMGKEREAGEVYRAGKAITGERGR